MTCAPPVDFPAEVEGNCTLDGKTGFLTLRCSETPSPEPGQFVMIRSGSGQDPFLSRPLAVAGAKEGAISLLYRVVGRGTALLASKVAGERVTVRGPIGKGFFTARKGAPLPDEVLLVGGGVGIAPLLFAVRRLGALCAGVTLGVAGEGWEGLAAWGQAAYPALDLYSQDGSLGKTGLALSGLPDSLPEGQEIWACGPEGMLRALVMRYPQSLDHLWMAFESRMACGMGGCLGCVIPTPSGNRRVCSDGPVFSASEVLWNDRVE